MTRPPQPDADLRELVDDTARRMRDHRYFWAGAAFGAALACALFMVTACGGGDPEPLTPEECAALASSAPPYSAQRPLPQECMP